MANHIKFKKSAIDSIPLCQDKQVFYRDTATIGFGLCVGKTKSYFAEKKMPNGKSKRKVIGKHGVYTLEQARAEAKRLLILMDEGVDPVQQKKQVRVDYLSNQELSRLIPTVAEAYILYKDRRPLSNDSIYYWTATTLLDKYRLFFLHRREHYEWTGTHTIML